MSLKLVVAVLAYAAVYVSAVPLDLSRRATINHDAVIGFPQTVPSGIAGELYLKYKPWLEVYNGCVPFPAVNAAGDTGGGLAPTGGSNAKCSSSPGQVYARSSPYNSSYAIMYSWYMPKDSPSDGLGHRHDWENAVVWLSSSTPTLSTPVKGIAISAHGSYQKVSGHFVNSRPKIGYISVWPVNHQLIDTDEQGGEQPLVAWESLTDAARGAIEGTSFGDATPSFRDSNFQSYLADAYI